MKQIVVALLVLVGLTSVAAADFDASRWVLLGERTVNGREDRDVIELDRSAGRFTKLTVRVLDAEMELKGFRIVFADRSVFDPKVAQTFRNGSRTRAIELPPNEQLVKEVAFHYRNLRRGKAKVQVWGWRVGDAPGVARWDTHGWEKIGERVVDGRVERDRIDVAQYVGAFRKLTIVVRDAELDVNDIVVTFARGEAWRPRVKHFFRDDQRTRVIDVPVDERKIRYVELAYRAVKGPRYPTVELWGQKELAPPPGPDPETEWAAQGWRKLGEKTVNGTKPDRDRIILAADAEPLRLIALVVLDSDVQMIDVKVNFPRGVPFDPRMQNQILREGTKTNDIDLPGDLRVVRSIELAYRNLPGGGDARVQVWGR